MKCVDTIVTTLYVTVNSVFFRFSFTALAHRFANKMTKWLDFRSSERFILLNNTMLMLMLRSCVRACWQVFTRIWKSYSWINVIIRFFNMAFHHDSKEEAQESIFLRTHIQNRKVWWCILMKLKICQWRWCEKATAWRKWIMYVTDTQIR